MIGYFLMLGEIAFLYFVITESIFGYILGKRIFGLKVVTVMEKNQLSKKLS